MRKLPKHEQEAMDLVAALISKAEGVFLWVSLVVDGLCERLRAGQPVAELQRHVGCFPAELEDYFRELILERIQGTWMSETAIVLKILQELGEESLRPVFSALWVMAQFGVGFLSDPDFILPLDIDWHSAPQYQSRVRSVRSFVNACCKDLVEVRKERHDQNFVSVDFNHRTVYDFVCLDEMQRLIKAHVPQHFCDGYLYSRLTLVYVKSMESGSGNILSYAPLQHIHVSLVPSFGPSRWSSYLMGMPRTLLTEHGRTLLQFLNYCPNQFEFHADTYCSWNEIVECFMIRQLRSLTLEILLEVARKQFQFLFGNEDHRWRPIPRTIYYALIYTRDDSDANREMSIKIIRLVLEGGHQHHPNSVIYEEWARLKFDPDGGEPGE